MEEDECSKKLSFLFQGSFNSLPESCIKLRSILNLHSSNIGEIFNLKLPKYFTSSNISCPYCYTNWNQNFHSFKLLPSTGKKFKKKLDNNNTLEGNVAIKDLLCSRNKLELKCLVCLKKSKFILEKPEHYKEEEKEEEITNVMFKKKKKKKKKIQKLLEGKLISEEDTKNLKKKKTKKKRLHTSNSNRVEISKPMMCNKNSQGNRNYNLIELNKRKEAVSESNSKKEVFRNPFNKINVKTKKRQLNRLKQAITKESNVPRNSLKDLLIVINK